MIRGWGTGVRQQILLKTALLLPGLLVLAQATQANNGLATNTERAATANPPRIQGTSEARLLAIYRLMAEGDNRKAFDQAEQLVRDTPNFQLAQLVYGDLLAARTRTLKTMGDISASNGEQGAAALSELRDESQRRVAAAKERPPEGTVPAQFLKIAPQTRTAIAIDTSRSRLYVFNNDATGLHLTADYYVSIGKAGTVKSQEGDQRTPLGIYFITSNLDTKALNDFYGAGAMPLNYPNILDLKRGKSGSGIWLHGTPQHQFSRAPRSTDGCLVLSNPDIVALIRRVSVGDTPVVVASQLAWKPVGQLQTQSRAFETTLNAWREAKMSGDLNKVLAFYTPDFSSSGKSMDQYLPQIKSEIKALNRHNVQLKDLSYLHWNDSSETMVTTFGEVVDGHRTGNRKRQYWVRSNKDWQIFFEGLL
jgi:murein L,D-transpeptidase YafK